MKRAKLNPLTEERPDDEQYLLKLFITGTTPNCTRAIKNIREFCEANLDGCYELEVVDLYQHPEQASPEQIVVTPTLVKTHPMPERRLVGNLSDTARIMAGLDIAGVTRTANPKAGRT
jgi:circadian clock protein KaiB